jgi:hypothetical protein
VSTSAITTPVLPVVIAQAEIASVAAASPVAVGVIMYHWPSELAEGT